MFQRSRILFDPNSPAAPAISGDPPMGLPLTLGLTTPDPNAPAPVAPAQPTAEQVAQQQRDQQFDALLTQNAQLMQMLANGNRAAPAVAPQSPQAPPPLSFEGLPDAVSAPKDFNTQLAARITAREQQVGQFLTHNITQQITRGAAMDSVFNRFQIQHSDLAKKGAMLQGAALVEFQALQAQGIDPVSVAIQNPDSLVTRIAQRMQQELGTQPSAPGPTGLQHGAPLNAFSQPTNAARVAGLQGGSGMPTPPAAPAPPKGFVDQLTEKRRAAGLI